jgi:hypothetical protein
MAPETWVRWENAGSWVTLLVASVRSRPGASRSAGFVRSSVTEPVPHMAADDIGTPPRVNQPAYSFTAPVIDET